MWGFREEETGAHPPRVHRTVVWLQHLHGQGVPTYKGWLGDIYTGWYTYQDTGRHTPGYTRVYHRVYIGYTRVYHRVYKGVPWVYKGVPWVYHRVYLRRKGKPLREEPLSLPMKKRETSARRASQPP